MQQFKMHDFFYNIKHVDSETEQLHTQQIYMSDIYQSFL